MIDKYFPNTPMKTSTLSIVLTVIKVSRPSRHKREKKFLEKKNIKMNILFNLLLNIIGGIIVYLMLALLAIIKF